MAENNTFDGFDDFGAFPSNNEGRSEEGFGFADFGTTTFEGDTSFANFGSDSADSSFANFGDNNTDGFGSFGSFGTEEQPVESTENNFDAFGDFGAQPSNAIVEDSQFSNFGSFGSDNSNNGTEPEVTDFTTTSTSQPENIVQTSSTFDNLGESKEVTQQPSFGDFEFDLNNERRFTESDDMKENEEQDSGFTPTSVDFTGTEDRFDFENNTAETNGLDFEPTKAKESEFDFSHTEDDSNNGVFETKKEGEDSDFSSFSYFDKTKEDNFETKQTDTTETDFGDFGDFGTQSTSVQNSMENSTGNDAFADFGQSNTVSSDFGDFGNADFGSTDAFGDFKTNTAADNGFGDFSGDTGDFGNFGNDDNSNFGGFDTPSNDWGNSFTSTSVPTSNLANNVQMVSKEQGDVLVQKITSLLEEAFNSKAKLDDTPASKQTVTLEQIVNTPGAYWGPKRCEDCSTPLLSISSCCLSCGKIFKFLEKQKLWNEQKISKQRFVKAMNLPKIETSHLNPLQPTAMGETLPNNNVPVLFDPFSSPNTDVNVNATPSSGIMTPQPISKTPVESFPVDFSSVPTQSPALTDFDLTLFGEVSQPKDKKADTTKPKLTDFDNFLLGFDSATPEPIVNSSMASINEQIAKAAKKDTKRKEKEPVDFDSLQQNNKKLMEIINKIPDLTFMSSKVLVVPANKYNFKEVST